MGEGGSRRLTDEVSPFVYCKTTPISLCSHPDTHPNFNREVRRSPTWHSSKSESALERFEPVAVDKLRLDGSLAMFAPEGDGFLKRAWREDAGRIHKAGTTLCDFCRAFGHSKVREKKKLLYDSIGSSRRRPLQTKTQVQSIEKNKNIHSIPSAHLLHPRPLTLSRRRRPRLLRKSVNSRTFSGRADNACTNLLGYFVRYVRTRGMAEVTESKKTANILSARTARTRHAWLARLTRARRGGSEGGRRKSSLLTFGTFRQ